MTGKGKYDFSGYATKNDLRCADGRIIRQGAFKDCDGTEVPMVWQHRHAGIDNVLGHVLLENREDGVYAYGSFNDTEAGQTAKKIVQHGDVKALSIYANQLKQRGDEVLHGIIREVSLVLAGANPGATIENLSFAHSDGYIDMMEDEADINFWLGVTLAHSDDEDEDEDEKEPKKQKKPEPEPDESPDDEEEPSESDDDDEAEEDVDEKKLKHADDETVEDVFNTLSNKQKDAVYAIVATIVGGAADEDEKGNEEMKHNAFDADGESTVLSHSEMTAIIEDGKRCGSLKEAALEHGITDIEVLFPEVQMVGGNTPGFIQRRMEWVSDVMGSTHKSPFARVKSNMANITMDEARARGYIKGNQKVEEQFTVMKRTTSPQTVYKLQKLDRDDIVDITDFDVVAWMRGEMRMMLDEEIARAILFGDGRSAASDDKISEDHIRPVWTDHEVFAEHTVLAKSTKIPDVIDAIIKAKKGYKGSGRPTMYIGTDLLTEMRLLRDGDGKRLYKNDQELADDLRVSKIVEVELMDGMTRTVNGKTRTLGCIIVNLADYNVGADKGGEVTLFDDFDLNFNKYEYLIETRISGALYQPKSALVIEFADAALPNVWEAVTPEGGEDPSALGWAEKQGSVYVPTADSEVKSGKTYYTLA